MLSVDVVVVAYNSREFLRECVAPLVGMLDVSVVVVDNSCPERSYEVIEDLPGIRVIHLPTNRGFGHGCNAGWRSGSSTYVLFLNPDATLEPAGVSALASELDTDPTVGLVGARTLDADGELDFTIRHFPSLVSTYAQALFVHRLVPHARWVDELVRERERYEQRAVVDWLSGACLLARRSVLEATGGFDEDFVFYSEDIDLCRRITRDTGQTVVYSPAATCVHLCGHSSPRGTLIPMLAASRLRYGRRYRGRVGSLLERVGIGIGEALRTIVGQPGCRLGHLRALGVVIRGDVAYRSPQFKALAPAARR